MMLFKKWIRIDLILLALVFLLNFIKSRGQKDALFGVAAALLVLTLIHRSRHYKTYKKFH